MRDVFFLVCSVLGALFLIGSFPGTGYAQQADTAAAEREDLDRKARVYLDCRGCYTSYMRRNLTFVDYVRDQAQADVHLRGTVQSTGGGGRAYRLIFTGRGPFEGMDYVLNYQAPTTFTQDERRRGLARTLRRGLVPYANRTPEAQHLDVRYEAPQAGDQDDPAGPEDDPWNRWVFQISGSGDLEHEETQREYGVEGEIEAERVTEAWKVQFGLQSEYEVDVFERDEDEIRSTSRDSDVDVDVVKSLGDHWAAGVSSTAFTRTFTNTNLAVRVRPAVEYNVFPYAISDEKELTFTYRVGPEYRDYREETIYGKQQQWLGQHSLRVGLDLDRPWGSVSSSLTGSHYFHDPTKNRLQFNNFLYVRLVEGLNLRFQFAVEFIQDQLHLPRGDVPLEEVLLRRQDLATDYELDLSVGLSYTFGSIYNNVVNTRL